MERHAIELTVITLISIIVIASVSLSTAWSLTVSAIVVVPGFSGFNGTSSYSDSLDNGTDSLSLIFVNR